MPAGRSMPSFPARVTGPTFEVCRWLPFAADEPPPGEVSALATKVSQSGQTARRFSGNRLFVLVQSPDAMQFLDACFHVTHDRVLGELTRLRVENVPQGKRELLD